MKEDNAALEGGFPKTWLSQNMAALAVIALFVLAKIPSLATPFWWDEAGAYIPPSLEVAARGLRVALPGLHPRGLLHGHPPVLYLIHGGLFRLFGDSILPHRIASLAFAVIGLWFTYKLGRLLFGRSTGVCAALLLACSSMFFAQSTMVLGDMPIASLGVASVYYLFARRWLAYVIAATLLVQTKETALAIVVAAALYDFFITPNTGRWRRSLMLGVPVASLAAFFAIEYVSTGTFVQAPYFANGPFFIFDVRDPARAAVAILQQSRWVARVLFYGEGRFIVTGMLLLGAAYWRKFWRAEFSLFGLLLAFYLMTFSLIGFLPRYVMPVLPLLCIAASWSMYVSFQGRKARQYVAACIASLLFLPFFYMESETGDFETNMQHEDAVAVCQRLAEYIKANFKTSTVKANFPIYSYLQIPALGYFKNTMPAGTAATAVTNPGESESPNLFVYFSIGSSSEIIELRRRSPGPPLQKFEQNGIFAEIYELPTQAGR